MTKSFVNVPLVIDFDKTLFKGDSLIKSFLAFNVKKKILISLLLMIHGKVYLKKYLWQNNFMILKIEFNSDLLQLAVSKKAFIVSGALDQYVKSVLLDFIPQKKIFGTKRINLTGSNKMKFLVKKFGYKKFDYIGDSFSDIHVWKAARNSYTVKRLRLYRLFVPNLKSANDLI